MQKTEVANAHGFAGFLADKKAWLVAKWQRLINWFTWRNFFIAFFNFFVVVAKCFLCFIGMMVFSNSWLLGVFTVWLMAGIQWEVNKAGFGLTFDAFRNLFSPRRKECERYLDKHLNKILRAKLPADIVSADDNSLVKAYARFLWRDEKKKFLAPNGEKKLYHELSSVRKIEVLREELVNLLLTNNAELRNLLINQTTVLGELDQFLNELTYKSAKRSCLFSSFLVIAIIGGIATGLAALSGIPVGIIFLAENFGWTFLLAIPGGAWIVVGALAAIGFSFLLYQTMSMLYEKSEAKADAYEKGYFAQQEGEGNFHYFCRIIGWIFACALIVVAIWGTFGTFWGAAKEGGSLLGMADVFGEIFCDLAVIAMIIPTFIFLFFNTILAVNNVFAAQLSGYLSGLWDGIKNIWNKEVVSEANWKNSVGLIGKVKFIWCCFFGFIKFINPFRLAAELLRKFFVVAVFVGHVVTEGMIGDHPEGVIGAGVPEVAFLVMGSVADAGADISYMTSSQNHGQYYFGRIRDEHHHYSWIIKGPLLLVGIFVIFPLDLLAVVWSLVCGIFTGSWAGLNELGNNCTWSKIIELIDDGHSKKSETSCNLADAKKKSVSTGTGDDHQHELSQTVTKEINKDDSKGEEERDQDRECSVSKNEISISTQSVSGVQGEAKDEANYYHDYPFDHDDDDHESHHRDREQDDACHHVCDYLVKAGIFSQPASSPVTTTPCIATLT